MKKFFKNLIYGVFFSLLLVTGIFSYTAINKASAVDTQAETTHTVNFYAEDNETILYSVEVPNGMSLYDLQNNNLLKNSDFSSYTQTSFNINSSRQKFANYWYIYSDIGNNATLTNSQNGFSFDYPDFSIVYQTGVTYYVPGDTLYISGKINNRIYTASLTFPDTYSSYLYMQPSYSPLFAFCFFINSSTYLCNFDFRLNSDVHCEYLNLGYQDLPYFNSDYVKKLYINNGGNVGSNFEWSESPTSSSRFNFDLPITKDINLYGYNFNGQTIDYTGEVTSDYGNLANYAIKDIEFFEVSGTYLYHMVIDTDLIDITSFTLFKIPRYGLSGSGGVGCDSVYINNSDSSTTFNMFIYSESVASSQSQAIRLSYTNVDFRVDLNQNNGKVHLWFSLLKFSPTSRTTFNLIPDDEYIYKTRIYDNLNSIVDMKSETNFSFNLSPYQYNFNNTSFNYNFLNYILSDFDTSNTYKSFEIVGNNTFSIYYSANNSTFDNFLTTDFTGHDFTSYALFNLDSSISNVNNFVNFNVVDCFFFIHRPIQRVDNTLVIYNFDYYNLLYSVHSVSYQLQADGDLYNVTFTGTIPNQYFVYISNENVINTIFDEYVYVYLTFNNNNIILDEVDSSLYTCKFGFDFNFTYYVQPLVTNNGVYSYTFDKPGYVEMRFSLVPFHLPVLEIAENILIFFMFYCPVIADLIRFMHFDLFFGGLLKIFDMVVVSGIGDFVLSCFAFLIFWSLLKGLFPSFISSGRAIYDNSQFAYNRRRDKENKLKSIEKRKEHNYKIRNAKKR